MRKQPQKKSKMAQLPSNQFQIKNTRWLPDLTARQNDKFFSSISSRNHPKYTPVMVCIKQICNILALVAHHKQLLACNLPKLMPKFKMAELSNFDRSLLVTFEKLFLFCLDKINPEMPVTHTQVPGQVCNTNKVLTY